MDFLKLTSSLPAPSEGPIGSQAYFAHEPMKVFPASMFKMEDCPAAHDLDYPPGRARELDFPPGLAHEHDSPPGLVLGSAAITSWNVRAEAFVPHIAANQLRDGRDDGEASCELQTGRSCESEILPGTVVRFHGLVVDPAFNGVRGVVDRWHAQTGQWVVTLQGGGEKLANADHLLAFVSESYRMPHAGSSWLYSVVWVKPEEYCQWERESLDAYSGHEVEAVPRAREVQQPLPKHTITGGSTTTPGSTPTSTKNNFSSVSGSTSTGGSMRSPSDCGNDSDDVPDASNPAFFKQDNERVQLPLPTRRIYIPPRFEKFLGKGRETKSRSRSLGGR